MLSPSLNKDFTYLLKTIKIMSILISIWSDSLVVSSQFEKDHPNLDQIFGWETFLWLSNVCILFKSKLFNATFWLSLHLFIWIFSINSLGFIHSFFARGYFCCLLIVFANSLDPGQHRQNIGPELDTDRLPSSDRVSVKVYWKSWLWKKVCWWHKSIKMTQHTKC